MANPITHGCAVLVIDEEHPMHGRYGTVWLDTGKYAGCDEGHVYVHFFHPGAQHRDNCPYGILPEKLLVVAWDARVRAEMKQAIDELNPAALLEVAGSMYRDKTGGDHTGEVERLHHFLCEHIRHAFKMPPAPDVHGVWKRDRPLAVGGL